jgi:hypothetical protein
VEEAFTLPEGAVVITAEGLALAQDAGDDV